ncbi:MAG: T9SS type A sorting domain-containing protein [Bacteroidales bacterium]|nr:T9SS type A sorting domain-containing protein [Bacteroidales bacterium]
MKKLYLFLSFITIISGSFAQSVADTLVRDSIPILLTDTTSYNSHARMMIYSSNYTGYSAEEDSSTAYLLFYDKQPDTALYSSIWYRELRTMSPETVFLQSNDSVRVSNPQATNSGVVFYEERQDSSITVKGLLIDPLTMTGLDTVTVFTTQAPAKMVANSMYVFLLKDSILFRQSFSINSNMVSLGVLDTLSTHATDVCVADYIGSPGSGSFLGNYAFTCYDNSMLHLYYGNVLDSGLISDIHYNYSEIFFYKKEGVIHSSYYGIPIVRYGNDTLIPNHAVGTQECPNYNEMAFVPETFPNVFNFSYLGNSPYYFASDTFVYPSNYPMSLVWGNNVLYAYPFPNGDTIKSLIMYRGFIIDPFVPCACSASDGKIIIEVQHLNVRLLYLVRITETDCFEKVEMQKTNLFPLMVFPNPVKKEININFQSETTNPVFVTINNLMGQQVDAVEIKPVTGKNHYLWKTADLPHGVYLLILMQDGKTQTVKFVK